jgi:hypothetical protein
MDIVSVADRTRISLGLALAILVARKTAPTCRFHVALPQDSTFESSLAAQIITDNAASVFSIPAPDTIIDGKIYRIENKINALKHFGDGPAILIDSDLLFIRDLPFEFIIRDVPTSVPEHGGKMELPWEKLYETVGLLPPKIKVLTGSGIPSMPWFNAGFVACPNAEKFGHTWHMMAQYVRSASWVPSRWPYTDQIALPLAMAQLHRNRTVEHEHVLPAIFNQNMFYWSKGNSAIVSGYVCHHHNRVGLLKEHLGHVLTWAASDNPAIHAVIDELSAYDKDKES